MYSTIPVCGSPSIVFPVTPRCRLWRFTYKSLFTYECCCFRSSFSDFAQKYAKDERFKGVEKMRERESLFNEYLIEVRKEEKEKKIQRRETVRTLCRRLMWF